MDLTSEQLKRQVEDLEEKYHKLQSECNVYREMVEQARDMIQSVREDGTFAYVNNTWCQILGYTRDEVSSLSLFDIIDPSEHEHCHALFKDLVSGGYLDHVETVFLTKAGRKIHVSGRVNCRLGAGNKALTLGIFRDISDQIAHMDERERLIAKLQDALAQVKTLSGLLPICSSCKNIRDDRGYWKKIESFIKEHSNADFSHGICPDCAVRKYPELYGTDRVILDEIDHDKKL